MSERDLLHTVFVSTINTTCGRNFGVRDEQAHRKRHVKEPHAVKHLLCAVCELCGRLELNIEDEAMDEHEDCDE